MNATDIAALLRRHRYRFSGESELQAGLAQVLTKAGIGFTPEVILGPADRIDFMIGALPGAIGVEVKIKGGLSALTRQLHRYAAYPFAGLIVVTQRLRLGELPDTIGGVPLEVVSLGESGL